MKRIIPFFAVCLALSAFQTGVIAAADIARTTQKRDSVSGTIALRSDNVSARQKSDKNRDENTRTSVNNRTTPNTPVARSVSTNKPTTKNRTNIASETSSKKNVTRSRSGTSSSNNVFTRSGNTRKTAMSRTNLSSKNVSRATTTRAKEIDSEKLAALKSQDYSKCKSVYYNCMDEFCANKDASLRRCACSSRIHEFDSIKKQLDTAEDKMLDFNQRLLVVGLDKEDAAAINVASEGELGYSKKDTSGSEKTLKKITDALNSSSNSKINNDLAAISLSLDFDSAWDSIDSISGVSTTAKNGVDLYNAARPICVEMAKEICSEHEIEITQSNYQLAIQQDCDTVAKSYNTKYNQAIEKIHESSALLDMARLDAYQQRNSDDILTCKKKILDKMSETSVCGENLHKCLDITGQYINPATGNAFLSTDLYNINNLLSAPDTNKTWADTPQNKQFVSFLNSKKTFLESATEQCQDIADNVWKDFLEDALVRIKLAQNAKIEEIRQSCTTLVAECKTNTLQNLTDFDARAMSTFEVLADATTNAICADVQNACTSLLNASGGGGELWESGMSEIVADMSYDAIIKNCTMVGQDCIVQQCNGTGGNFSLCGDFASAPRRAILKHQSCWNEVQNCVKQATNLDDIKIQNRVSFYNNFYGIDDISSLPGLCAADDKACLITEQIWGNCEYDPATTAITTNGTLDNLNNIRLSNKILVPLSTDNSSLLSWLAYNTGTTDAKDSCSAYNCPINYKYDDVTKKCSRMATIATHPHENDNINVETMDQLIYVTASHTNYCEGGASSKDIYGNCCASGVNSNGICVPSADYTAVFVQSVACDSSLELENAPTYYCAKYESYSIPSGCQEVLCNDPNDPDCEEVYCDYYYIAEDKQMSLYCITTNEASVQIDNGTLNCNGYLVLVDQYGNYMPPLNTNGNQLSGPHMSWKRTNGTTCTYIYQNNQWGWSPNCGNVFGGNPVPKNNHEFMITYPNQN